MREALTAEASVETNDSVFAVPEATNIQERLVVSPQAGRFWPLPADALISEGEWVEPGQPLAEVHSRAGKVIVRSSFRGWVMGMLAVPGQPVSENDALFWIRSF